MRTVRLIIAATIAAAIPSILVIRDVQAQETIVMEEAAMGDPGPAGADCNCRAGQRPPQGLAAPHPHRHPTLGRDRAPLQPGGQRRFHGVQ